MSATASSTAATPQRGIAPLRSITGDWHAGTIPANAVVDPTAFVETTYSFTRFRSARPAGLCLGKGASVYQGVMFDVGSNGVVTVGRYTMLNGGRIVCDAAVDIGDFALISWNVVIMDTYRVPMDASARRSELERLARRDDPTPAVSAVDSKPVKIADAVWIGFDACVLPGISIGTGSIVGARSVVTADVQPFTVVAGNPARLVRRLELADPEAVACQRLEAIERGGGLLA